MHSDNVQRTDDGYIFTGNKDEYSGALITVKIDNDTKLDSYTNMRDHYDNYEDGDTVLTWLDRLRNGGENGALTISGVYGIFLTGDHVDRIQGLYWWD